jgi:large subunit ribosomal protein L32e
MIEKKKKPEFKRQEWYKKKSLGTKWRKPRGIHSKLRRKMKCKGRMPDPGYRSPKSIRGLNRFGYKEILIRNVNDLKKINPEKEVGVIARTVGNKKRMEILKSAREHNIKIVN